MKTYGTRPPPPPHPPTGKHCQLVTDTNDREEDQENVPSSEYSDSDSLEVNNKHSADNPADVVVEAIYKVAEQMENIAQRLEKALVAHQLLPNSAHNAPKLTGSQDPEPPHATPSSLCADEDLMVRVARHLRELGDDEEDDSAHGTTAAPLVTRKGKRSGQIRRVHDIVIREVDWPNISVYRGLPAACQIWEHYCHTICVWILAK